MPVVLCDRLVESLMLSCPGSILSRWAIANPGDPVTAVASIMVGSMWAVGMLEAPFGGTPA